MARSSRIASGGLRNVEAQDFELLLAEKLAGVATLSPEQISRLYSHYELLRRWNRTLNLTSIQGLEEAVERHYCESIFLGAQLPQRQISVLDVGSGAGFPGIPMAVLRPDCRFTLAESRQRKAVFLKEATRGWRNVRVLSGRVEALEEGFDWVVSRAVNLEEVLSVAARLGNALGLLVGEAAVRGARRTGLFEWEEPIPLPWGRGAAVLLGRKRST